MSGLTVSQRAMRAARIYDDAKAARAERSRIKADWIDAARGAFRPAQRMPCAVCGKYQRLAHAHHVFPLAMQFDCGVDRPIHDYEWLCPTHHEATHIAIAALVKNVMYHLGDMPPEEKDAVDRITVKFVRLWGHYL